jgi:cold shock CspA family protein
MADTCTHVDGVGDPRPSGGGCVECREAGTRWVHLRICMTCGHVGCCDASPGRHATAHWHANRDHPLIRSFEPGENWWWCYADELFFELANAPTAPSYRVVPIEGVFRGQVKFFNATKGWGAITSDELPYDVWVYQSTIEVEGYRELTGGQLVDFRCEECWGIQDSWHYRTTWVKPVGATN